MARTPQIGRQVRRIALGSRCTSARAIRERWPDQELYSSWEVCYLVGIRPPVLRKWHYLGYVPRPELTVPCAGMGVAYVYGPKDIEAIEYFRDHRRIRRLPAPGQAADQRSEDSDQQAVAMTTDRWWALALFVILMGCLCRGVRRYERDQQQQQQQQGEHNDW